MEFTIDGVAFGSESSSPLQQFRAIPTCLSKEQSQQGSSILFSIGRRISGSSLEYFGSVQRSAPFPLRFSDIKSVLSALHIQVNTRGKFIIQQSELLSGVRQKKTGLLDIIEESVGSAPIVQRIEECEKQEKALRAQKESVEGRLKEIEAFQKANEEEWAIEKKLEGERKEKEEAETEWERAQRVERELEALLSKQAVEAMRKRLEQSAKEWEEKKKEAEECNVEYEKEKEKKKRVEEELRGVSKEVKGVKEKKQALKRLQLQLIDMLDKKSEVSDQKGRKEAELVQLAEAVQAVQEEEAVQEQEAVRAARKKRTWERVQELRRMEEEVKEEKAHVAALWQERASCAMEEERAARRNALLVQLEGLWVLCAAVIPRREERARKQAEVAALQSLLTVKTEAPTPHPLDPLVKQAMPAVQGLLARLPIRVRETRLCLAINTALRSHLERDVVVGDRRTAAVLVDLTREKRLGRVNCLIVAELGRKEEAERVPGALRMIDCLCFPQELESVVRFVTDKWYVVEDKESAIALQRRKRAVNCVTVDGVLFLGNGEVRRGACQNAVRWRSEEEGRVLSAEERREKEERKERVEKEVEALSEQIEAVEKEEELKADTKATRSVASVDRLIARAEKQIQLREREMASMCVENAEPVSEAEYETAEAVLKTVVGIERGVKSRTNGRRRCTVWEP